MALIFSIKDRWEWMNENESVLSYLNDRVRVDVNIPTCGQRFSCIGVSFNHEIFDDELCHLHRIGLVDFEICNKYIRLVIHPHVQTNTLKIEMQEVNKINIKNKPLLTAYFGFRLDPGRFLVMLCTLLSDSWEIRIFF